MKPQREIKAVCTSERLAVASDENDTRNVPVGDGNFITSDVIVHSEVVVTNEAADSSLLR